MKKNIFFIFFLFLLRSIDAQQTIYKVTFCLVNRNGECVRQLDHGVKYLAPGFWMGYMKNYKYCVLNDDFKQITNSFAWDIKKHGSEYCFHVGSAGHMGVVNVVTKSVLEPVNDYVSDFEDGYAIVSIFSKSGVVNEKARLIVPVKYDEIILDKGRFIVRENGLYGYLDGNGNQVLPNKFDRIRKSNNGVIIASNGNKHSAYSISGKLLFGPNNQYSFLYPGFDSTTFIGLIDTTMEHKKNIYLLNAKGKRLNKEPYDNMDFEYGCKDGKLVVGRNEKYGIIDKYGHEVLPLKYNCISYFTRGYYQICGELSKYGIMDSTGAILFEPVFYWFKYEEGVPFLQVSLDKKWAMSDFQGKLLTPYKYDYPLHKEWSMLAPGKFPVTVNGRQGVIDDKCKELIPPLYEEIRWINDDFYAAKKEKNGLFGFFDFQHHQLVPFKYYDVHAAKDGLALVEF